MQNFVVAKWVVGYKNASTSTEKKTYEKTNDPRLNGLRKAHELHPAYADDGVWLALQNFCRQNSRIWAIIANSSVSPRVAAHLARFIG